MTNKLYKIVDGIQVELTQAEVDDFIRREEEHNAKVLELSKLQYIEDRKREYPSIGDQLDAVLKQFETLKDGGMVLTPDMDLIVSKWRAVKTKYPKPTN